MVKKICTIFVLFLCAFSIAQKQVVEKTYNTEYDDNCKELTISEGKPIFIVVCINNGFPNDSLIAVREFKELKKNFIGSNFYLLEKKGKLKFKNLTKQILSYDEVNDSYEKIIYWDGKKGSEAVEYDNLIRSSEYFSEILDEDKTSSYIQDYNNKINDFNEKLIWSPNENSRKLSDKYIKNILFNQLYLSGDYSDFLNFDLKGVKKLVVNSNLEGTKNPWQEISFNKEGLPTSATVTSDDSDGKKSKITYLYKDNLLSKVTVSYENYEGEVYEYFTDIYYSDGNLIVADDLRVIFYSLKSDFLVYKSYYMSERTYDFLIDTYDFIAANKLKYTENNHLNNRILEFNSKENFFPITDVLRPDSDNYTSVLTKINDLNFDVTRKNVTFKKIKYLNKGLISEVLLIDPDDISRDKDLKQYKFEYKYEYYK